MRGGVPSPIGDREVVNARALVYECLEKNGPKSEQTSRKVTAFKRKCFVSGPTSEQKSRKVKALEER